MSQAISFTLWGFFFLEDAETHADTEQLNAAVDVHKFDCFSFFSECVGFKHTTQSRKQQGTASITEAALRRVHRGFHQQLSLQLPASQRLMGDAVGHKFHIVPYCITAGAKSRSQTQGTQGCWLKLVIPRRLLGPGWSTVRKNVLQQDLNSLTSVRVNYGS